jgi:hypothetical protein
LPDWALQAIERLQTGRETALDCLWTDPGRLFRAAGMEPDPWQLDLFRSPAGRLLLLCSRQAGKSELAAALALHTALLQDGALVLLLSPSERQSGELAQKVFNFYDAAGQPVAARKRTELQLHLTNGSRIIALPGKEATVRCFSGAALLVVDEASRVSDALYLSVRPMLAVSKGRLLALSTPFGKRGFFYEEWSDPARRWQRVKVTAPEVSRISPAFLAEEREALGDRWYRQEYECSFEDIVDACFRAEDIAALTQDAAVMPLFGG